MTVPEGGPHGGGASHAPKPKRRFKATFWPTVVTIPMILILIGLGVWQLQRLHWKEDLVAERQSRSQGPAITVDQVPADMAAAEFLLVQVTGDFRHDQEFYLGARTREGRVGFNIVTPFVLEDGRTLLVNRGWVPQAKKTADTRPEGQVTGRQTIEGLVRQDGWKGVDFARPENLPGERFYYWVDLPVMFDDLGEVQAIDAFYLEAGPAANPGGLPKGGQTRINLRNDHLEYALTWFALAIALAIIYFLFHYRPSDETAGRE